MKGAKPKLIVDNDAISKVPAPPSWMAKDAKAEWRRIMPALVDRKILTNADMGSVENYCVSIGRAREVEALIQKDGIDPVLCRLQDKAVQTARQLAAELGLTPVSRSRPSVREGVDDDDTSPLAV
jgi:P27 family predicted phage terminase small subunit